MVESNSIQCNSIESIEQNSIDTSNLKNQQFRLNKISEFEDYFKERELMSKKLSKYPSRQILVPRKSLGRPRLTFPGRPLKVLFGHPGDVPI